MKLSSNKNDSDCIVFSYKKIVATRLTVIINHNNEDSAVTDQHSSNARININYSNGDRLVIDGSQL